MFSRAFRSQRVICMGVFRVMMVIMVMMVVIMSVVMMMVVMVVVMITATVQAAHPGAKIVAKRAIGNIGSWRCCPLPFDMVMMAFLRGAYLVLKSKNLGPVLAQGTVHIR